uniref:Immunoglobulin domain-containing protein n=1 Tax=Cairina moschata TaxID=8855 RepID=A0A8C3BZW0_CAIMO
FPGIPTLLVRPFHLNRLSGIVEQSPVIVDIQQGQSISITCAFNSSYEDEEICLVKTHMQPEGVLCISSQKALEIFPAFANRLEYSKEEKKLVITLHNLQQSDNDVYVCVAMLDNSLFSVSQRGTMVLVKGIVLLFLWYRNCYLCRMLLPDPSFTTVSCHLPPREQRGCQLEY